MNLILSIIIIIFFITQIINPYLKSIIIRNISFIFSLILFITTIFVWIYFNPYEQLFQLQLNFNKFNFSFHFGIDGISLLFIFLTTFLIPICILFNWNNVYKIKSEFYTILIILEILLILIFTTQNLLFFYICFEIILIPLFILIGINNYKKRRIHAAYLFFLYTLLGSLFMLITILYLYSLTGSLNYYNLYNNNININIQKPLWIMLFLSLSIKIPLFPFHIWLPEAHVEAPTEGSILLAGILLKLGIYGYIRILIPIFYQATIYYLPLIFTLITVSGVYASFVTLRQTDMKRIIAYSSIAHMAVGIYGLFTIHPIGISGSLLMMFSHGIISGALFLLIGILYDRFKTKTLLYYNGITQLMPLLSFFFFFFILGNISFPGTSSFISESLILLDIINIHIESMLFISIIMFICTLYSLLLFNKIFFGIISKHKTNNIFDITRREFHLIIPFLLLMLWIGIYPSPFIKLFESNIFLIAINT